MTNTINKYYNIRTYESTVVLELDYMLFLENKSYEHKQGVLGFLDEVDRDSRTNVLIISNNHPDFLLRKYKNKWDSFVEGKDYENNILRAFRTFNELFVRIAAMKMVVISMNSKALIPSLFNFSMAADLRVTSEDFYVDNNNHNLLNITKGGAAYPELLVSRHNPFKLLFLLEKVRPKTLYKRQIVDRIYKENLEEEVLKIAKHLSRYEYYEYEVIKSQKFKQLSNIENALRNENDFLLTCIRKKVNQGKI